MATDNQGYVYVSDLGNRTVQKFSSDGGFLLRTSSGAMRAQQVVLASGGYQKPHRPPAAAQLPASLLCTRSVGA